MRVIAAAKISFIIEFNAGQSRDLRENKEVPALAVL
jgi:hypothetical protein